MLIFITVENDSCTGHNNKCNCDVEDGISRTDSVVIRDSSLLPLSTLSFQGVNASSKSRLSVTVGNLTCFDKGERRIPMECIEFLLSTQNDIYIYKLFASNALHLNDG